MHVQGQGESKLQANVTKYDAKEIGPRGRALWLDSKSKSSNMTRIWAQWMIGYKKDMNERRVSVQRQ
jgi:hypothetical protein